MSEQIQLNISGMSCASCVGRIEKALAKVAGVEQVSVNLASETATISGLSVSAELLMAAVEKAGYQASLPATKPVDELTQPAFYQQQWLPALC